MTLTYEIGYSIKSAKAELELLECFKEFNSLMRRIGDAVERYENTVDHKFNYKNINDFRPFMDFFPFQTSLDDVPTNWGDVKVGDDERGK